MKFVSIFLLLLPLISPKLLLLVEYSRHGARSPEHYVRPELFPEGIKNITPEGMFQHYQIGRELRKRYVDDLKFLPAKVTPNTKNIRVFSSGVVRSYASGAAQLMGLYGENTGPVIEGEQIWFKPPFNLTFDESKNNATNQTTNKNNASNTTNEIANQTEQNNNANITKNQTANQTSNQTSHDNATNQTGKNNTSNQTTNETGYTNTTTNYTTNQTDNVNTTNQTTKQAGKENVTNQTTNQTGQCNTTNQTSIDNSTNATTTNQTGKDNTTNQTATNHKANTTNQTSADNITNGTSQSNSTNETTNQTGRQNTTDTAKNQTDQENIANQTTNQTVKNNTTNDNATNQTFNKTDNDNITNQTSNQTRQQTTTNQTNQTTNQTHEGKITNQTNNKTVESNSTNKTVIQTSNETEKINTTTSNHTEQVNTTKQISNKTEDVNNTNQTTSQTIQINTTNQTSVDNTTKEANNHSFSNFSNQTTNQTSDQTSQTISNNTNQTANHAGLNNLSFASTNANADFQTVKTNIEKKFAVYNGIGIIPILQMDPKNDLLFQPYKFCPSLVQIGKDLLKDPAYLNLLNQWRQDLFPQLANILQKDYNISVNVTNEPLKFIKKFHDLYESAKFHKRGGLDLKFANETELQLMETRFYAFMNLIHELRPITLKINLSPILEDIVESMMKRIADENMHISEEEKLKFLFFSGRDKQMFALLNLLLLPEDRKLLRQHGDVPFASLFLFELHQDDLNPNRHFVRVSYNDEPLKMKGCSGEKGTCELNEFFKLISGGISDNFYRDCGVISGRIAFE